MNKMNKKTEKIYIKVKKLTYELLDYVYKLEGAERLEATIFITEYFKNTRQSAEHEAYRKFIYLNEK